MRGFLFAESMHWTVYILYSTKLDRFYTGCTSDIDLRFDKHKTHFFGNTVFTSKADDWEIFLTLYCASEKQAKAVELHIKKMKSKTFIQNLKMYPELISKLLKKYASDC